MNTTKIIGVLFLIFVSILFICQGFLGYEIFWELTVLPDPIYEDSYTDIPENIEEILAEIVLDSIFVIPLILIWFIYYPPESDNIFIIKSIFVYASTVFMYIAFVLSFSAALKIVGVVVFAIAMIPVAMVVLTAGAVKDFMN